MFKRIGHIVIIILLLVSTNGMTIYRHYCGNRLINTTVDVKPDNCCNGPCKACHNEVLTLKVKDKFVETQLTVDFTTRPISLFNSSFVPVNLYISENTSNIPANADLRSKRRLSNPLLAGNKEALLQVFLF